MTNKEIPERALKKIANSVCLRNSAEGFTLIELLISLTIVAVILVIIQGALRIGVRAWEAGEKDIDINQRQQIVLSLMKQQLASVCWNEIKREEKDPYYFSGKADAVEFISTASIIPGNQFGKIYVAYKIASDGEDNLSLQVAEQSLAKVSPDTRLYEPESEEFQELIGGAEDMSFEFLQQTESGESQWQDSFPAAYENGLPAAIRFNLKMSEMTQPTSIIIRVVSEKDLLQEKGSGLGFHEKNFDQ